MARRRRREALGVDWFLPGRKRPIATSTQADYDLIVHFARDGRTWEEIAHALRYSPEARQIIDLYVQAGLGTTPAEAVLRS